MVYVYWIHLENHTDMFSEGYIGVSQDLKNRFKNHVRQPTNKHMANVITKYGWDNLVKTEILIADKEYCLEIERKLRPKDFIGWNATAGGGFPPKAKKGMGKGRKLSQDTKDKIAKAGKGRQFSMESLEKIRQKSLAQWARYRANGNKHTPLPAETN